MNILAATGCGRAHYARFAQMILNGGELEGRRYLSPGAFKHMTTDEVGPGSGVSRALFLFCRRWFWIRLPPGRAHRCGTSKTAPRARSGNTNGTPAAAPISARSRARRDLYPDRADP